MDKIFARLAELESELKNIAEYIHSTDLNDDKRFYRTGSSWAQVLDAAYMARQIASELALEGWRR